MSSKLPREDRALPIRIVPGATCPRKLQPGQAKRYMSRGPLIGYMMACPACGFIELHLSEKMKFTEESLGTNEPPLFQLVSSAGEATCMLCRRIIRIADGCVEARATWATQ